MKYDLAIIGGGPAGYSAALAAVEYGLTTVLFEKEELGGTCLNRGCIPTKTLLYAAELYEAPGIASRYGITFESRKIDFSVTRQEMKRIVEKQRNDLTELLKQRKIQIVYGTAKVLSRDTVIVDDEVYRAKNLLIATGSKPVAPAIEGALTSDEVLKLEKIPCSMKIIGGGIIALEFAHLFHMLGSSVTICLRSDRILRKWDREIAVSLAQSMKQRGIQILPNCTLEQMQAVEAEVTVSAIGRIPNLEGLFVSDIGLVMENGILTDSYGRTNIKGVYAAGDVTASSVQLAHTAMAEGRNAVAVMAGAPLPPIGKVVHCIYVQPEIASVGLTEAEAKEQGIRVVTGKQTMLSNARTLIATGQRGFIKLVADAKTQRLLGAQLFCERASDIAAELVLAIDQGMTVKELIDSAHPHPSFCEAVTDAAANLLNKL